MINPWLQFLLSAAVIVYAGSRLTRNAALVADKTGISTAWAGALMLPLATSLPELVTTLRAVSIEAPDLALGNILGSCLFNLALLAAIDLVEGRGALSRKLSRGHIITAALSIITVSLAAIAMLDLSLIPVGWVGLESLLIAAVYILGSRLVFRYERRNLAPIEAFEAGGREDQPYHIGLAVVHFVLAAVFIVGAGVLLTDATDRLAALTGLGHSFAGALFLAVSTSLPEIVTTISAVRLGYLDMAVANVFGANFMNFFVLFLADLFYRRGPLLYEVSDVHQLSALMLIILSAVFIFGLVYRSEKGFYRIGFDTVMILAGYLGTLYIIFKFSGNQ